MFCARHQDQLDSVADECAQLPGKILRQRMSMGRMGYPEDLANDVLWGTIDNRMGSFEFTVTRA